MGRFAFVKYSKPPVHDMLQYFNKKFFLYFLLSKYDIISTIIINVNYYLKIRQGYMKKLILSFILLVFGHVAFAVMPNEDSSLINKIGQNILTSNRLPNAEFVITSTPDLFDDYFVKANLKKKVELYEGDLSYAKDEGEITAVIAAQVGKISNNMPTVSQSKGTSSGLILMDKGHEIMSFKSTKITSYKRLNKNEVDLAADRTGVDFLIQNGSNPLAMISLYGRYLDDDKNTATVRIMNVYDYINYNFPEKLKQGYPTESYKKAMAVVNAQLNSRTEADNQKIRAEQAKINEKKLKQANSAFKGMNPWNSSYTTLLLHK